MESIKTTYQGVAEFYDAAQNYLKAHPEDNKFRYALTRTCKSLGRALQDYRDETDRIEIENCLAADDGKGEILRDPQGRLKFTKDGMRKRSEEIKKVFRSEVEVDVHFATDLPGDLSLTDRDNFTGFVIREPEETKLEVVG